MFPCLKKTSKTGWNDDYVTDLSLDFKGKKTVQVNKL